MKKLLLATAVAALSVSAAHAAPTVYGKVLLSLDYKDFSGDNGYDDSTTSLNNNGSKIGVKGAEALTANTDLIYQLEYRVHPDDGGKQQFTSRDTYIGFSNKQYGTLLAGRLTTIDDSINYANVTAAGIIDAEGNHGADDVLASITAVRANNALAYISPSYNGLNFMGMYSMDEGANSATSDLGVTSDIWGVGAKYEPNAQPYRAGATYMQTNQDGNSIKDLRVSGAYDITPATTIGALYQTTDFDTDDNEQAFAVSATYKTATPWTAYGQVDVVNNAGGEDGRDKQRYTLGGKYAFNDHTTGHVYGAYAKSDNYHPTKNTTVDIDGFGIGTGIEYKF